MTDISSADRERRQIVASLELATADAPTPPTRADILTRLAAADAADAHRARGRQEDGADLLDTTDTAETSPESTPIADYAAVDGRRRSRVLLVAAAVLVAAAGAGGLYLLAPELQQTDVADTDEEGLVFNCFEWVLETVLDADGNDVGQSLNDVQQTCYADADGTDLRVVSDERMSRVIGPQPSTAGGLVAVQSLEFDRTLRDADTGEVLLKLESLPVWFPDDERFLVRTDEPGFVFDEVTPDGDTTDRVVIDDSELPSAGDEWALRSSVVSPDGRRLATVAFFAGEDRSDPGIPDHVLVLDLVEGSTTTVVAADDLDSVVWAPGGGLDVASSEAIVRYDLDGGEPVTVFDDTDDYLFGHSYSPDGQTMAVTDGAVVRLIDLSTGEERRVDGGELGFTSSAPDWSADGSRLVTGAVMADSTGQTLGLTRIAVIDAATGSFEVVTADGEPISASYPRWR